MTQRAVRGCDPRSALAVALCGGGAGMVGPRAAAGAIVGLLLWLVFAVPGARRSAWRLLPLLSGLSILALLLPFAPRAAGAALVRGTAISLAVAGATLAAAGAAITSALAGAGAPPHGRGIPARPRSPRRRSPRGGRSRLPRARAAWRVGPWVGRPRAAAVLLASVLGAALARADRTAEALALRGFAGRLPPLPKFDVVEQLPHLATAAFLAAGLLELVK